MTSLTGDSPPPGTFGQPAAATLTGAGVAACAAVDNFVAGILLALIALLGLRRASRASA
ncbi:MULTISPECIES: hypothetical protein [unclassified Micromonospora]|uniref:hypothetical protein n=1 Tax=unclassified Micromonospora TaxID=2617518 RepID=UPI002FF28BD3